MNLFYHPTPSIPILSEVESTHAIKVLRLKEGDTIQLLDGIGGFHTAIISKGHAKHCEILIQESRITPRPRSYRLHIAVAPTKSADRIEWFVEKAIEIGVDELSFLHCEHSERKNMNLDRIEKIVVSALKQSMNFYKPILNPMVSFNQFVQNQPSSSRYIAHLEEGEKTLFKNVIQGNSSITLLIGPEGDFSPKEIQLALGNSFMPVSLGETRLRTETAALAGCFICNTALS